MERSNYNLNQFYHEAKILLEKYDCVKPLHYLNVSFDINEKKGGLATKAMISYENDRANYTFFSTGSTPPQALQEFEEDLQKASNAALSVNKFEADFNLQEEEA